MLDDSEANHVLNTSLIGTAALGMFGPAVAVAVLDPRLDQGGLMGSEVEAIAAASPRRVREFTAGRVAARMAMVAMGLPVRQIPVGKDRAPIWPQGVSGSISHCATCCIAVAAPVGVAALLGVDVEPLEPLEPELQTGICTPSEMAWLERQDPEKRDYIAKLIFSAKESAYKCQYPLSRRIIGFDAIEITPDLDENRFVARFAVDNAPFRADDLMVGQFMTVEGLILTGVTLGT